MNSPLLERFLRYVKIDTQSKDDSDTYPSTSKQFDLLNLLHKELQEMGLADVSIDTYGYVMATLPSNVPKTNKAHGKVPTVAFIAHVDTSPEVTGANVKPNVIQSYDGKDLTLAGDPSVVVRVSENPELKNNVGKTIVTTDGTTLLGADDKAGVAIVMTAIDELKQNPSILHGDIRIVFTPDEEIGQGTRYLDLKKVNAGYAYTVDGDTPGELNQETFSANMAVVTVKGRDIHPGSAKNIMVNSVRVISDFISRLPKEISPECTDGYEPYIHPYVLEGGVAQSSIKILFRDFKTEGLKDLESTVRTVIDEVRRLHPKATIEMKVIEQYRNMKEGLAKDPRGLDALFEATERAGLKPHWKPIRGGTDGSRLTEMGLPCPNIFTGGQNYHSRTEWVSVWGMEKSVETVKNVAQIWVEKS